MTYPTPQRKLLGLFAMIGAVILTVVAYANTRRETARLAENLDINTAILDSGNCPAALIDAAENIVRWNVDMERLTGLTMEQANKVGITSLICEKVKCDEYQQVVIDNIANPRAHQKLAIIYCTIRTADKGDAPARMAVRSIVTRNGMAYTLVRIDRESQIVEYGSPPERAVEAAKQ